MPICPKRNFFVSKKISSKPNSGFTLIELMVVVSIIVILSFIGLTIYNIAQRNARDAKRRSDLEAIHQALELYRTANGSYPQTAAGWVVSTSASDPWLPNINTFMSKVPKDPTNDGGSPWGTSNHSYGYYTADGNGGTNGSYYMLIAKLESPNNDDLASKCTLPDGTCIGSTNSGCGTDRVYTNDVFYCNQQ